MALRKSIVVSGVSLISGADFVFKKGEATETTPELYIKVETVYGDKNNIRVLVTFKNQKTEEHLMHREYSFTPNLDAGNFIAQAYEHLKTLPEFSGAIDC
jgi:hypothetical protein